MKKLTSLLLIFFFLANIAFVQAQEKQQVKKDVKVEKVTTKDQCCPTEKSSDKAKDKESCNTEKSKAESKSCCKNESKSEKEEDSCCKTEKSTSKVKEQKE